MQVARAELEAAKRQVSTLKAALVMSHKAADSARAASDSLAQQMRTSADTELSKVVQKIDAAEAEVQLLRCRLANTQAGAQSEAAKFLLLLDKSRANAASSEQGVKRLEQQLAGSQAAAAPQQEELRKLHQTEIKKLNMAKSEVQAACINLPLPCCACLPLHHPPRDHWLQLSCTP